MKRVEMKDVIAFNGAGNVTYSPDGRYLAFTVISGDWEENGYRKNVWMKKDGEEKAKQLTFSGKDSEFIWDDEETLLMITSRTKDDISENGEKTSFYRLNVTGGEARKVFDVAKTVVGMKQAAKGEYLFFVREDRNALPELDDNLEERKEEKDYHVIDEVPVWGNGRGFVSGVRIALYLFKEADKSLKRLSPANMDVAEVQIRGTKVLCLGKEWADVIEMTDSVLLFDLEKDTCETLLPQGIYNASHVMFVGERIVLTGTDMVPFGNGQYHDFYEYDCDNKTWKMVCRAGRLLGVDIMTDCNFGTGDTVISYGDKILAVGQCGYRDSLFEFGTDNQMKEKMPWNGVMTGLSVCGSRLAFSAMEANRCAEIYECDLETMEVTRVSALNDEYLDSHFVAQAKHIPFVNAAGITVDGWVLEPEGFDPTDEKKYPGILEVHGGPRCTYGEVFYHEMQTWVSKGWFVFFCNPRGSEGYGEEFADLRGKYGTIDYEDVMAFTDHVLKLYPQIDRTKLGVSGGSYGGFMCNWIEGHTDRFAAICSQRSVSNWVSDFGLSEIGVTFDKNEMGFDPWTGMEQMWEASPVKYANNAKTPILFIHSLCDYNCTIDQGMQMFTAMKYFGVPTRMCLFEGENHSLSRSGKPKHRVRRLKEMTDWFIKYLEK